MKVALVETASPDRPGSMQRYADLIELVLQDQAGVSVSRVSVAPSAKDLQAYPRRGRMLAHHATVAWRTRRIGRQIDADLIHVVDGSHGYAMRWLKSKRCVVTVHDLIPYLQSAGRFPETRPSIGARWLIGASLRSLNHAACIVAVSQCTARDLIAAQPSMVDRVRVVPSAIFPSMLPKAGSALPDWEQRKNLERPYLLHLGNNGFYKNRKGVVRIFERLRAAANCRLVLAGPPPDESLRTLLLETRLEADVDFVVDPDDAAIQSLYRNARLLLFPSIYEGFGWPPLEAMAWNCPVVCSRAGSLAEVVGAAALTSQADNEAELAANCLTILRDRTVAEELVLAGQAHIAQFSFDHFRQNLLRVYRSLV